MRLKVTQGNCSEGYTNFDLNGVNDVISLNILCNKRKILGFSMTVSTRYHRELYKTKANLFHNCY
jgi:hypothetical protein